MLQHANNHSLTQGFKQASMRTNTHACGFRQNLSYSLQLPHSLISAFPCQRFYSDFPYNMHCIRRPISPSDSESWNVTNTTMHNLSAWIINIISYRLGQISLRPCRMIGYDNPAVSTMFASWIFLPNHNGINALKGLNDFGRSAVLLEAFNKSMLRVICRLYCESDVTKALDNRCWPGSVHMRWVT